MTQARGRARGERWYRRSSVSTAIVSSVVTVFCTTIVSTSLTSWRSVRLRAGNHSAILSLHCERFKPISQVYMAATPDLVPAKWPRSSPTGNMPCQISKRPVRPVSSKRRLSLESRCPLYTPNTEWKDAVDKKLTKFVLLSTRGDSWPSTKSTKFWEGASKFLTSTCGTKRTSKIVWYLYVYSCMCRGMWTCQSFSLCARWLLSFKSDQSIGTQVLITSNGWKELFEEERARRYP